jgi:hypothetical protein
MVGAMSERSEPGWLSGIHERDLRAEREEVT